MKTFDQCKDEVARKNGYLNWEEFEVAQQPIGHEESGRWVQQDIHWEQAAELYAQEVAKEKDKEIEKLQAFKSYVHKRLDDAGIPVDPESPHKEAGCRIGGRLDIALNHEEVAKDAWERACEAMVKSESVESISLKIQQLAADLINAGQKPYIASPIYVRYMRTVIESFEQELSICRIKPPYQPNQEKP